ncbi:MAG: hypothetical protein RIR16_331 [Actinomycetota bacterium]
MTRKLIPLRPHRTAKTLLFGDAPRRSVHGVRFAGAGLAIFAAGITVYYIGANNLREASPGNRTDETNRQSIDCTIPALENTQSDLIQIGGIRSYRASPKFEECDGELIVLESLGSNSLWKKIGATEVTPID